jgi:hypothetical protein
MKIKFKLQLSPKSDNRIDESHAQSREVKNWAAPSRFPLIFMFADTAKG